MNSLSETFQDWAAYKKAIRTKWSVDCPRCAQVRPKAPASKLLPQQRCKVDGYVDPRPRLTEEQKKLACEEVQAPYWERVK